MKTIVFCLMIIMICVKPFNGFGQSKDLVDSINKIIAPQYYIYFQSYIEQIHKIGTKEFAFLALDTANDNFYKVFVVKAEDNEISIIDSSTTIESIGRQPTFYVSQDSLFVVELEHHGAGTLTYKIEHSTKKFKLVELQSFQKILINNNDHSVEFDQDYNIFQRKLFLTSTLFDVNGKILKVRKKYISKDFWNLNPFLIDMKDPLNYDEVFEKFDSKIYKYMTTFTLK